MVVRAADVALALADRADDADNGFGDVQGGDDEV